MKTLLTESKVFVKAIDEYFTVAEKTESSEREYNIIFEAIKKYMEYRVAIHGCDKNHHSFVADRLRDKARAGEITVQQAQRMLTKARTANMDSG